MSICSKITQNAEKLSAISAVIGGALEGANAALGAAIESLSPFVEEGEGADVSGGVEGNGEGETSGKETI